MASSSENMDQGNIDDGGTVEVKSSTTGPSKPSLPLRSPLTASETPIIKIDLLLSPPTHCFTRASAPVITLKLALLSSSSSSPVPVTLYTEKTPLDMRHALSHRGFRMRDLTAGGQELSNTTFVNNAQRMACPRLRVRGCFEEPYFVTLYPSSSSSYSSSPPSPPSSSVPDAQEAQTVELSHPFGRGDFRPQPWSVVQLGHEVDEAGHPRTARRSKSVTGVDGLEPGHEYEVGLDVEALRNGVMWAPAPKEDILLEEGYRGPGRNLEDYAWVRDRPLDFRVGTVRLKVLEEKEGDGGNEEE